MDVEPVVARADRAAPGRQTLAGLRGEPAPRGHARGSGAITSPPIEPGLAVLKRAFDPA